MSPQTVALHLKYSHTIGLRDSDGPSFRYPSALAINHRQGCMYVVSRAAFDMTGPVPHARVTICTLDEKYLGQFGSGGTDDGQFMWPTAIAIDKDDKVYASDEYLNRISIFSSDGQYLGKWGIAGPGDGQLNRPAGLAFDSQDNVLVVDGSNNRIQKFTKDGRFLAKWGRAGNGDGEFNLPWGIDIDQDGSVYIADWRNDRIQKFNGQGAFLMKFGSSGTGDGQFNLPTGVAADKSGVIYVADCENHRLQVFDAQGGHLATLLGEATLSKWAKGKVDANSLHQARADAYRLELEKRFLGPIAVDVDTEGRVLVLERGRHRIQVYTNN